MNVEDAAVLATTPQNNIADPAHTFWNEDVFNDNRTFATFRTTEFASDAGDAEKSELMTERFRLTDGKLYLTLQET